MEVVSVTQSNMRIYLNLLQAYEAEFSAITKKLPNQMGLFDVDTELVGATFGLLCYQDDKPIGLAAIKETEEARFEVCEFYIIPVMRNMQLGERFAHAIWQLYPGQWKIKQIANANKATEFWRKTIVNSNRTYTESVIEDSYWGLVTQQCFSSKQQD